MEYKYELYHHGTKGMKWGIRRYQNKDGSLTPAGKKRRARLEGELEKLGGKKNGGKDAVESAPRKKTVSEMTDAELREHTNRMQLEANYYNARKNLSTANPKQVNAGKKFINSMLNDVVTPVAKNAGRAWLEKTMKNALGLKEEKTLSWDDKIKKQTWEKNERERKDNEQIEAIKREAELIRQRNALKKAKRDYEKDD